MIPLRSGRGRRLAAAAVVMLWALARAPAAPAGEPLPSWRDGPARQAIEQFVARVTTPGGDGYVPPADRIAVFDNDGTLWSEQPLYVQLMFVLGRVKSMAPDHPDWKIRQPFKGILEGDLRTALARGERALRTLIAETQAGTTPAEFRRMVKDWLASAVHPKTGRRYTEMVFQPMRELLSYFRDHGFTVYIVTGGTEEFVRAWAEPVYGVPPEQVVGTWLRIEYRLVKGVPTLLRRPEVVFLNNGPNKPVAIQHRIGRRPLAAFGNSDGDLPMLRWVAAGAGPRLAGVVHHTDAEREWAYDRNSSIGRLDKALDAARANGWVVIDMKKDWRRVFPPDPGPGR